ncbi:hypothetical protein [Streptomyces sp. URMC 124]|uniref:hypothetical protein n=1 Tax=Streptomyces sp. URMC 124 TaxID=3423405 RepID=UPI003F195013
MTIFSPAGQPVDQSAVYRELADAQEQIRNANSIGATLLGASITGAGIAVPLLADRIGSFTAHQPALVLVLAAGGVAGMVLALWQLLSAVLPRVRTAGHTAPFLAYATAPDLNAVRALIVTTSPDAELRAVSRIARAKYLLLRGLAAS